MASASSSTSSLLSSPSSSSSQSPTSASSSSILSPSSSQRRGNISGQGRRKKPVREWNLLKPSSDPAMFTMKDIRVAEADTEQDLAASHSGYRRCMTDTDFKSVHGWTDQAAPDLLQLFSIFQFNKPEKPPARMLINVTLVGNIHPVRLLVAYDASVLDIIKASLKAFVKEDIDPTEHICSLGTRSFFLFPGEGQLTSPTETSREGKPWWNIFA